MKKLDASGDGSFTQFHRLLDIYGPLPEYVKQANPAEANDTQELLPPAFADPLNRQFPCHTKAACYVSTMYFLDSISQLKPLDVSRISSGLQKAAEDHGILSDLEQLVQKSSGQYKTAACVNPGSERDYALVQRVGDTVDCRYPLRNAKEVKAAAEWFTKYRNQFRFDERQQIADRILDKAAEFGAAIPESVDYMLNKQAGRGTYEPQVAASQLQLRASMPGVAPEMKLALQKLATALLEDPALAEDPTTTRELARTMDMVDRTYKLAYTGVILRPEDVLFGGSFKYAGNFMAGACPTLTGSIYQKEQFEKLSVTLLRETLGDVADEVADQFGINTEKLAEIVTTLPLPDAVRFDQLMAKLGEQPAYTKSAAVEISDEERKASAREYLARKMAKAV